jgi:hypothetical protein
MNQGQEKMDGYGTEFSTTAAFLVTAATAAPATAVAPAATPTAATAATAAFAVAHAGARGANRAVLWCKKDEMVQQCTCNGTWANGCHCASAMARSRTCNSHVWAKVQLCHVAPERQCHSRPSATSLSHLFRSIPMSHDPPSYLPPPFPYSNPPPHPSPPVPVRRSLATNTEAEATQTARPPGALRPPPTAPRSASRHAARPGPDRRRLRTPALCRADPPAPAASRPGPCARHRRRSSGEGPRPLEAREWPDRASEAKAGARRRWERWLWPGASGPRRLHGRLVRRAAASRGIAERGWRAGRARPRQRGHVGPGCCLETRMG